MSRIALVTTSSASLPDELVARYHITIAPHQIDFLSGRYEEGGDVGLDEFYRRLASEEVIPSTTPPSPPRYERLFRELAADHDAILAIHLSSSISRSYANAVAAAEQVREARVVSFDSGSAAMGLGLQVLTAARLIERGAGLDAILAALEHQRERTLVVFTPATLRFMRNSRRIGPIVALLATWLNIKPVIRISQGKLELIERARTREAALDRQIDEVVRFFAGAAPAEIGICHGNVPDEAQAFAARVRACFPEAQVYISDIGAVVTVHIGPGALGLMTYRP
jgi:DegV family protein with EDD domain